MHLTAFSLAAFCVFLVVSLGTFYVLSQVVQVAGKHRRRSIHPFSLLAVTGVWELSVALVLASLHQWQEAMAPGLLGAMMIGARMMVIHLKRQFSAEMDVRRD